jgi:predicted alpha/beta-hydrolase family hydrolase
MASVSERIEWRVNVGTEVTTAVYEPAVTNRGTTLFVCAHGAGGHMHDAGMLKLAEELRARGMDVVRFNFLYREKAARAPDPMPRLMACFAAVTSHAREGIRADLCIIGGRSMGGRAASMLAAEGFASDGLLLLAYPLHPAGKPEQLRDAHLGRIAMPVLCLNGTRDSLCRRDLMDKVVAGLPGAWTMHWLEGADHGFHVLRASGRSDGEVLNEIGEVSARWRSGLREKL